MADQIPIDVQQRVAHIFKQRQSSISDITTQAQPISKPISNAPSHPKTLRAVDPFNIPLALDRLMALLHLDGGNGARADVKTRGYYLNIII